MSWCRVVAGRGRTFPFSSGRLFLGGRERLPRRGAARTGRPISPAAGAGWGHREQRGKSERHPTGCQVRPAGVPALMRFAATAGMVVAAAGAIILNTDKMFCGQPDVPALEVREVTALARVVADARLSRCHP